jgi:Flp pilus assembly protein TadD
MSLTRHVIAVGLLGLLPLLSGCASIGSMLGQESGAFDAKVQAELIRKQQEARAATAVPVDELEPESLEFRLLAGDEHRLVGEYANAMWSYLKAHELDPEDTAPILRMASLHLMADPDHAEKIFLDLVAKYPERGAAYTGLGLVRIARHDWEGARDALIRAVARSPRSALAHSALGVCLDRTGDHDEARQAYQRAVALHPDSYEALNNLGVSYLTTGDFAGAEEALRRASTQQSRDPAVFNNLGLALGRLERYDEALEAFRQAGPEQAARNNLGYVAYLNGNYGRARAEYELALLARGDQRLEVLRNLQVARDAERQQDSEEPSPQD